MANNGAKILKEDLRRVKKELTGFVTVMGVEAKNHFVESFQNQGFTDETLIKWTERKSLRDRGRAILVKSGNLRRSIRIISKTFKSVTIGSDLVYAKIHNDGLRVRGHKMPKRQFIGNSGKLNRLIEAKLDLLLKRIFK